MRPNSSATGGELYECFECGVRVEAPRTRSCDECGGELRNISTSRDE